METASEQRKEEEETDTEKDIGMRETSRETRKETAKEKEEVGQLFKTAIDKGLTREIYALVGRHGAAARDVRYAVQQSASIDLIRFLASHVDSNADMTELDLAEEIAVDRGEAEEIALVKMAKALSGS